MSWITETWRRIRAIGRRAAVEDGLDQEMKFHVEQQIAKNLRAGITPDEARRQALVKFGGVERAKEMTRDEFRSAHFEDAIRDVRYGVRSLRRSPGFTVVAILTLALGIGATTAVFSVVNGVLIKPLPYPDSDRLVDLSHAAPGVVAGGEIPLAASQYFTYREHSRTFQDVALWSPAAVTVTGAADPERIRSLSVTHNFLQALGASPPVIGRWFTAEDDAPGSPETVVLTHGYWQRRHGGDASIVGQTVTIDTRPRQVIGVMPPEFRFLDVAPETILPQRFNRSALFLVPMDYRGVARLKPGVAPAEAAADVARMNKIWLEEWPMLPGGEAIRETLETGLVPQLTLLKQHVVGDVDNVLWVVLGTVGVVLLIACANVANLLLVRAEGRQQELAIRTALGAGRGRLVRSLLLESVVLSVAGGALGLALAFAGVRLLVAIAPANLPRLDDIAIDPAVLAFTLVASLMCGIVFGLVPALKRMSPDIARELTGGGRTSSLSRERRRTRSVLVVVQVSLATVLLVASGLMIRSFVALKDVPPGFADPSRVQLMSVTIPRGEGADAEQTFQAQAAILDRIAAIPGAASASFASTMPMQMTHQTVSLLLVERALEPRGQSPVVRRYTFIAPGYFRTLGIPVVAGRDLDWSDIHARRPVALVSENVAREMWGNPSAAIGQRVREADNGSWREVVGVVADVHDDGVHQPALATVYWPAMMENFFGNRVNIRRSVTFAIRSDRAGTESLAADIREAVRAVNGDLPVTQVRTLDDDYGRSLASTSFTLVMLAIAGTMALLLSVIGIYGVLSYAVTQRTREIGIRTALGAPRAGLRAMFVRDGLLLAVIGVVIGLVAAGVLTRTMTALLFGVSTLDPMTYVGVAVVLAAAAVLASYIPARRATAVDPVEVLRGM